MSATRLGQDAQANEYQPVDPKMKKPPYKLFHNSFLNAYIRYFKSDYLYFYQQMQKLLELEANCLICFQRNDDLIRLNCNHHYCSQCLRLQYQNFEKLDSTLYRCSFCKSQLNTHDFKKILSESEYKSFIQKAEEELAIFGLPENEKVMTCLNEDCQIKFIIWKDADYYSCQFCHKSYCLICHNSKHTGRTCQEYYIHTHISKSRLAFQRQVQQQFKNQMCPHCLAIVEKVQGCNFMTCNSIKCKGERHFCYTCGVGLTKKDESKHFESNNSFSNKCRIKINDTWVDQDKIPPNEHSCPGCETRDRRLNKIEKTLQTHICYCQSEKCLGKTYCLKCLKCLDDKTMNEHLDGNFDCEKIYNITSALIIPGQKENN